MATPLIEIRHGSQPTHVATPPRGHPRRQLRSSTLTPPPQLPPAVVVMDGRTLEAYPRNYCGFERGNPGKLSGGEGRGGHRLRGHPSYSGSPNTHGEQWRLKSCKVKATNVRVSAPAITCEASLTCAAARNVLCCAGPRGCTLSFTTCQYISTRTVSRPFYVQQSRLFWYADDSQFYSRQDSTEFTYVVHTSNYYYGYRCVYYVLDHLGVSWSCRNDDAGTAIVSLADGWAMQKSYAGQTCAPPCPLPFRFYFWCLRLSLLWQTLWQ